MWDEAAGASANRPLNVNFLHSQPDCSLASSTPGFHAAGFTGSLHSAIISLKFLFLHSLPSAGIALKSGLLHTQYSEITRERLASADATLKKKFNRYSSNSKKKSEENTYVVTSAQKCSGELNHIITDAFILYGRYWRVYRRRLITFTLKVYEEMFTRQSWAVNPDFRHVLVSITSDWHVESHDRNVVVYRMRRVVGLWDSWQEEVYKPLTPLSIVEH